MRWFFLLIFLAFISCREKSPQAQKGLFNVDSLLDMHINYLSRSGVSLVKESSINSNNFTSSLKTKSIEWQDELEPFRAISIINKPTYFGSYDVTIIPDGKSNLLVKEWVARDETPIKSLKIYFLNSNRVKRLEATLIQTNFVFTSRKNLMLEFAVLGTKPLPERYEISGHQKFFWEEPQDYKLACEIQIN